VHTCLCCVVSHVCLLSVPHNTHTYTHIYMYIYVQTTKTRTDPRGPGDVEDAAACHRPGLPLQVAQPHGPPLLRVRPGRWSCHVVDRMGGDGSLAASHTDTDRQTHWHSFLHSNLSPPPPFVPQTNILTPHVNNRCWLTSWRRRGRRRRWWTWRPCSAPSRSTSSARLSSTTTLGACLVGLAFS
jgi:hypothetical protein